MGVKYTVTAREDGTQGRARRPNTSTRPQRRGQGPRRVTTAQERVPLGSSWDQGDSFAGAGALGGGAESPSQEQGQRELPLASSRLPPHFSTQGHRPEARECGNGLHPAEQGRRAETAQARPHADP